MLFCVIAAKIPKVLEEYDPSKLEFLWVAGLLLAAILCTVSLPELRFELKILWIFTTGSDRQSATPKV